MEISMEKENPLWIIKEGRSHNDKAQKSIADIFNPLHHDLRCGLRVSSNF